MARYTINGVDYVSVTEVIGLLDKSKALMPWAVNSAIAYIKQHINDKVQYMENDHLYKLLEKARTEYRNISQEALDIGSEVHKFIESYIKKSPLASYEYDKRLKKPIQAFLQWEKDNIKEWCESELTVYDDVLCYAGTLDAIAILNDGKKYVIDFKSSKGFYDGYDLQIAAYMSAYNEMNIGKTDFEIIDNAMVLRLDKLTGIPESKDYSKNIHNKFQAFKHLLDYYYMVKSRRLANNPRVNNK